MFWENSTPTPPTPTPPHGRLEASLFGTWVAQQELLNKNTCLRVHKKGMSSCCTRQHVFCAQEDVSSCYKRRPVAQEDVSSCAAGGHILLCNKNTRLLAAQKTCLLAAQDELTSCWTRGHVFCLFSKRTWHLARQEDMYAQEDMSSCWARRHAFLLKWTRREVFLFNERTSPLVQQEDMSSCSKRKHVVLLKRRRVFSLNNENPVEYQTKEKLTSVSCRCQHHGGYRHCRGLPYERALFGVRCAGLCLVLARPWTALNNFTQHNKFLEMMKWIQGGRRWY